MNLLFVCTGNTCRSCMAEGIAKYKAGNMDIDIASAGIYASKGDSASLNALRAMKEMGIDVSCHMASPVTRERVENSDLILTMTYSHRDTLRKLFPKFEGKIFSFLEYIDESGDIEDPFGKEIDVYNKCAQQIAIAMDKLFKKLRERKAL